ncbi:DUF4265 domain-containing protein [Aureispira anguillae]|uniref:DUF4265 domain-containing protein n=1 Tax=Aureispira anguillae TaxID=2864201 RepID=A0A915YLK6_9BACT|nr:DUF4265 domain-containing protein [Aureispira anguillae]BDS15463.1 DUF4265 domain-containing protein [Aureispira anguillae]
MTDSFKKVLFRYHSPVLGKTVKETMWAIEIDADKQLYKLDSIPFYGPPIATHDEFIAKFDEQEGFLVYQEITTASENSIVLVIVTQKDYDKEMLRRKFKALHCESEGLNDHYFSMEILKRIDYTLIKKELDLYQQKGIIDYAEPCLSNKHKLDLQD